MFRFPKPILTGLLLALLSSHGIAYASQAYIMSQQQLQQKAKPDYSKAQADFQKLNNSINALTLALQREGTEYQPLLQQIKQQQQQAQQQAQQKQYQAAMASLQQAYRRLTQEIINLKDGQTPVDLSMEAANSETENSTLEHHWATNRALLATLKQQAIAPTELHAIESLQQQAQQANDRQDQRAATQYLLEARAAMQQQIVQHNPVNKAPTILDNTPADLAPAYQQKRSSMLALIDAARRISQERQLSHRFIEKAETDLSRADAQLAQGKTGQAQQQLDSAWIALKSELRQLLSQPKPNKPRAT